MNNKDNDGVEKLRKVANPISRWKLGELLCAVYHHLSIQVALWSIFDASLYSWVYVNVEIESHDGAEMIHLRWTLLLLKTYDSMTNLAGTSRTGDA